MDETKTIKLMDLAGKLGLVLGLNPVWKDGYVIYSDGEDCAYTELMLDICTGRWQIFTDECGVLFLSKEAIALMGKMSKIGKGKEE
jgi:hypothetical protein